MTAGLPSREQAIKILEKQNCPPQVINHCKVVAAFALEIAKKAQAKGCKVNLPLVEGGALLHDIGRSKTHGVQHGLIGAQIAQTIGLPQPVIDIIRTHVGAGITKDEATWLEWPAGNYMPTTLEEKIVCYADKRIDHDSRTPIEVEVEKLQANGYPEAAERVRRLHNEISHLLGESP